MNLIEDRIALSFNYSLEMPEMKSKAKLICINQILKCLPILLSGCAVTAIPYDLPAGSRGTKFTIENSLSHSMFVHAYDDAEECQGRKFVAFMQPDQNKTIEVSIEKEFAFSLTALVPGGKYCKMIVSFSPENGNDYYSTMNYDQKNNICGLSLHKTNGEGIFPITDHVNIREEGGILLDESSRFCKKRNS